MAESIEQRYVLKMEVLIVIEGNFLIFSDTKRLEDNIIDIKNNTDILILKQEGIL